MYRVSDLTSLGTIMLCRHKSNRRVEVFEQKIHKRIHTVVFLLGMPDDRPYNQYIMLYCSARRHRDRALYIIIKLLFII